jgi:hypothetical protein
MSKEKNFDILIKMACEEIAEKEARKFLSIDTSGIEPNPELDARIKKLIDDSYQESLRKKKEGEQRILGSGSQDS